jgi:hypothetical protein
VALRFLLGLAVSSVLVFGAENAHAFCRTHTCETQGPEACDKSEGCLVGGPEAYWPSACLAYAVQSDGSPKLGLTAEQVDVLVAEELGRWSGATCAGDQPPRFFAQSRGAVLCDQLEFNCEHDNVNVVIFQDDEWPHRVDQLALTTVTMITETGKILDADMELNTALYAFRLDSPPIGADGATDLRMVFAHELGHFLGLSHSNVGSALMFERGKFTPDLTADDEAGVCAIYPPANDPLVCSEVSSAEGAECHGKKDNCPKKADSGCSCELPRAQGAWSLWTLALLPLAASRRRFGWLARRLSLRQSTKTSASNINRL